MNTIRFLIFFLLPFIILAQTTFDTRFEGRGHSEGFAVCETGDGGFVATGFTRPVATDSFDVFIVKVNNLGELLWSKVYGGDKSERAYTILSAPSGACFVAGYTQSWGKNGDCYLLKIDADGDTVWTKYYGRQMFDWATSITQTFDGKYIVAGYTEYGENGNYDVYLSKLNDDGHKYWSKSLGEFSSEEGHSVIQTADSGFVIVGSQTVGTSANKDLMIMKTDSSGTVNWIKTYGGDKNDLARSVIQLDDKGYIIAGYTQSFGANNYNVYLVRTGEDGDTLWTRVIRDVSRSEGYDIIKAHDGGFIVVGVYNSDVLMMKTNENGDTLWTKKFASESRGFETGRSIKPTADGGYVIAGYYNDYPGYELYIIKTDAQGIVNSIVYPFKQIITDFNLYQNYPNPFNNSTMINYQLSIGANNYSPVHVELAIYNILGQKVATLVNKKQTAGRYSVQWDASGMASGVYLYKIRAGSFNEIKKMILIK